MHGGFVALIALVPVVACGGTGSGGGSPANPTPVQYTLALHPTTGEMIVKVPNDAQHPAGTTVTLNAIPLTGYQFTRWEGDVTGAVSPTTIVMNGNRSVTAVFTALPPATLSVMVSPVNGGTVTKSPDQPEYAIGTTVTLTAVPAAGYQFTRWEGSVAGSNNPTQVVISMTSLVRAVFTAVR